MATYLERHPSRAASSPGGGHGGPADAPLLLIHGLGGDRQTWRPVLDDLSAEHDVLVVELPGFGASPALPPEVEPSPVALAAAVLRRLDEAGVGEVHVIGHSLGGWVALELADLAPSRVRSVTALTPAGFWPQPLEDRGGGGIALGRRLSFLVPLVLAPPFVRNGVLTGALGGPGGFGYRDAVRVVSGYVGATDYPRVNAAMRRGVFATGTRLAPMAARVPVVLIWADGDRMVAPAPGRAPEGVLQHVLLGAGHLPTYDQPAQTAAALLIAADRAATPAQVA